MIWIHFFSIIEGIVSRKGNIQLLYTKKNQNTCYKSAAISCSEFSAIKWRFNTWQFDSVRSFANPWPFTNFVGLISTSYSITFAIHLPLFPSLSGCTKISLTAKLGTYARILECKTYILKNLRALTNAYDFFPLYYI